MKAENLAGTDDLSGYTPLHRENYLFETEHLISELPHGVSVLQVGSMDGARAIGLLQARPDLVFTGLDIEPSLTDLAVANAQAADARAAFITGDILTPPPLPTFDVALCLNNTLSYIVEPSLAIANMRAMAARTIVSVFTEAYDWEEARSYYDTLGMSIQNMEHDAFVMSDGWRIHRFTSDQVSAWDGAKQHTPLGWIIEMSTPQPAPTAAV